MTDACQIYRPCMKRLMLAIGKQMSDDPERWIAWTYISTLSSFSDFMLEDSTLQEIGNELGLKIKQRDRLGKIADQMVARGDFNGESE